VTGARVLITGATGFIGRHAIGPLQQAGFGVHALTRAEPSDRADGVTYHIADLIAAADIAPLLRAVAPTHLLHLAWDVTPGRFWNSPANLTWVAASMALYRAFVAAGGRRAVFAGTCAEYDWSYPLLDETRTALQPATLYGTAKHALHQIIAKAAALDQVSVAWARLFMLYGPHENENRLVPTVATALLRGRPALCGNGAAERDFMHVADAGAALACVLGSDLQDAVNIASGSCVPIRLVIDMVAQLIERPELVRLGTRPDAADEPPRLAAATQLLAGLGFRPAFTLASGLADTVGWWRRKEGLPL
jgi:nucleoside-diphosphate-sugar epimerase